MRSLAALLLALGIFIAPATVQAAQPSAPAASVARHDKAVVAAKPPATYNPLDDKRRTWAGAVSFVLATIVILAFVRWSEVLRDSEPVSFAPAIAADDDGAAKRATYKRSYSLSQSQVAWWFWIVVSSYLYIAWRTGDIAGDLNQQTLVLLGIGAGTAVGAAIIDQSKKEKTGPLKDMADAVEALRKPETDQVKRIELYETLNDAAGRLRSVSFLTDVLSDADGISLHRFQSFAWTVVLGVIFLVDMFGSVHMPRFSDTQLALLGISAGTYLGLKIPEQP